MDAPAHTLRLLAWNILHGGGLRTPEITLALLAHTPDIAVLAEFRPTRGSMIRAVLADHALSHQHVTPSPPGRNGILIASRTPLALRAHPRDPRTAPGRFLACHAPEFDLTLAGVHAPDDTTPAAKQRYWHFLIDFARAHADHRCIVLGDFNAGRRGIDGPPHAFAAQSLLGAFCSLGFTDAWRARNPGRREFSWYSAAGTGFRLDGAYVSTPLLPHVQAIAYSALEREEGLSDHAALLVDLHAGARPAHNQTPLRAGLFRSAHRASVSA